MWPFPQFQANLDTSLKKSLMENFIFCAVCSKKIRWQKGFVFLSATGSDDPTKINNFLAIYVL